MMEQERVTRKEAAALLGCTPQTIANLAARGALTVMKEGRWWYFSREEINSLIPKTDALRDVESAIAEVVADLEREKAARVTEAMVYKARREFIEQLTDTATFCRYQELVAAVIRSLQRCALLGEKMSEREVAIIMHVMDLQPLDKFADRIGLTRERTRQVFEKALRRMIHFSQDIDADFAELRREVERLRKENKDLRNDVSRLGAIAEERNPEQTATTLTAPIASFLLSVRTINCMTAVGIRCLRDLARWRHYDLYRIRNLGKKSIRELDELMERNGLHYEMTEEELDKLTQL